MLSPTSATPTSRPRTRLTRTLPGNRSATRTRPCHLDFREPSISFIAESGRDIGMCTNAMQGRRGYERDHLAGAGRLLAAYVFGDVLRAADPLEYAELDVGLGAPACGARLLRRLRLVPCTSRSAGTQGFSGSQRTGKGIPLNVRSMRRLWPNSSLPETS